MIFIHPLHTVRQLDTKPGADAVIFVVDLGYFKQTNVLRKARQKRIDYFVTYIFRKPSKNSPN